MRKEFQIVIDSTADLRPEWAQEWGIHTVIPYIVTVDGKDYFNYLDGRDISTKDFYNLLRSGKTGSTTQITAFRYIEAWEPLLKSGQDILYLCLSGALSKSYEQSLLAVAEMGKRYPERKVISLDTKSASLGQGLLVYYAVCAQREGKTLEETATYVEGLVPRLFHWIMADDLHHLRRGGRVSGAAAFVGSMLKIKPMLTVVADGRIVPIHKVRGHEKAIEYILSRMEVHKMEEQLVGIVHSDAPELADQLKEKITAKYGNLEFLVNSIGPVIGAHTGPGTVAAVFLGDERLKGV
ncbi:MAG: DegV family protein [Defluviitaleaceae bacterium]|nr:DegV family protein [Defluviitaleaceae bacterium]MCL2239605.1 DegV family protein [Defluviitaleaceae bacterium]